MTRFHPRGIALSLIGLALAATVALAPRDARANGCCSDCSGVLLSCAEGCAPAHLPCLMWCQSLSEQCYAGCDWGC